jgi:hypothetical protein
VADIKPLVFVRRTKCYPVPPVCSAFWTAADWERTATFTVEPLVIDALGITFTATGERNARGEMLYRAQEVSRG